MATRGEIDHLISKRQSGQLTWVVAGVPVVACFPTTSESIDCLGSTSDRNSCHDSLLLWIAVDRRASELLVTLTIRIKASNNRKPNHRLLYLVVPAEDLVLHSHVVNYDTLGHLPHDILDVPNDIDSGKHKMLHLSLDLISQTSFVIMQAYPCPPKLASQQEALLRKLRNLSKASHFSLYTNNDDSRQHAIEAVCAAQLGGNLTTPRIGLQHLYPGGRAGCINDWENQGLCKELSPFATTPKAVDQATICIDQDHCLTLPPPYASSGPQDLPHATPSIASLGPPDLPSLPSLAALEAQEDISWLPPTDILSGSSYRHASAPASDTSRIFPSFESPPPPTPEPTLSSGYTATFLPSSLCGPIVQVAASSLNSNAPSSPHARTPSLAGDSLPDSTRKRHSSTSLNPDHNSAKRAANWSSTTNKTSSVRPLHLSTSYAHTVPFSPTIADTSHHSTQAGDGAVVEHGRLYDPVAQDTAYMSAWLRKAWTVCPSAHYTFIAELLRLGAATAANNADDMVSCSASCTLKLLRYDLQKRLARQVDTEHVMEQDVFDNTSALVSWLCNLQSGADVIFYDDLLDLASLEDQLLESSGSNSGSLKAKFLHRKAELVSQACTRLADGVLRQGEDTVVARLSREKGRLATGPR